MQTNPKAELPMPFESLNIELFQIINAPAHPAPGIILAARILAEWVVYAAAIWMVAAWIRTGQSFRRGLLDALLAAMISLGINQLIGLFVYHPRPFDLNLGHQFLAHGTETSFPSDHAVLMFSIAFTLLLTPVSRGWGWLFLVFGVGVAWSRVYLGVHFPFDMIGAFIVAIVGTGFMMLISAWLHKRIYPLLLQLYETIISVLRLPESLFPRSRAR